MAVVQYKRSEIQCDFGTVPFGASRKQTLKEINPKTVPLDYVVEIEHHSRSSPDFVVEPRKFKNVKTNEEIKVSITYTPSGPSKTDLYYFEIQRSDGFVLHIEVIGQSIGPRVVISKNVLKFDGKVLNEALKKTLSIQNCSEAGANFMFDCNGVDRVKFAPEFGFLEPLQTLRIVVSYTNKFRGQKFHQFMCLIENHSPLPIYIISSEKKAFNNRQSDKHMLLHSIKTFLPQNEISSKELKRIIDGYEVNRNCIKLSETYIDFGTCGLGDIKQKSITLTNTSGAETTIQWVSMGQSDLGKSNVFRIEQGHNTILPSQSVNINLIFTPKQHDKFYSARFDATLFWMGTMILIPIKIILIGNSFQNYSWIAEYSLDLMKNTVHLLPYHGLKNSCNTRTFTLRRHSSLPMMFKLYSSTDSFFTIEPNQGVIHGPYQIFTIGSKYTTAHKQNKKLLNELWTLELNLDYQVGITISQTILEPNLIINNGKPVIFPNTHPLSCQIIAVELKNPTKGCFRYSFEVNDDPSSAFKFPKLISSINGNECRKSFWYFIPENIGHYECCATLLIYKIDSEEIIKRISINVEGECKIGHLKVDKDKLSLGKILLESYQSAFFTITNDGESPLNLSLGCKTLSGIELSEIMFRPSRLTIKVGESVQVGLKAKPICVDQHSLKIGCNLRSSPFSRQTISNSWMDLAVFDMIGVYPKLKIVDVRIESIPFITRNNLWNILEINRLNNFIGGLTYEDCTKQLEINLPVLKSYSPFNNIIDIEMLIKNESDCNIGWSLKRKDHPCSCKAEEKKMGFNTFVKELCCEHVNKIKIEPTVGILQSSKSMLWTIRVEYFPPGVQKVDFELNLFPQSKSDLASKLCLLFTRVVPDENQALFPCDFPRVNNRIKFEMQPIFINELKSQSQALWVYNPSKYPVEYLMRRKNGGTKYIKCLNPLISVQPFTQHAIVFSYLPITIDPVEAKYKILINNKRQYHLTVRGTTQLYPQYNPYVLCKKMATGKSMLSSPEVELSVNHIAFPVISPNCQVDRIFFINNKTNKTLGYHWQRALIEGRLKLEVIPKSGRIQPKQKSLLTVKCTTLGRACHLMIALVCRVVDETLANERRRKKSKFLKEKQNLAEEFTITEKGETFPEKRNLPEEEINQKFLILNVSVVSSTVSFKNVESIPQEFAITRKKIINSDLLSDSSNSNGIYELEFADILNSCLWDIVHNSDLRKLVKSGMPCVSYKDLSQRNISGNEEDEKCPNNCIITLLSRILSETLRSTEQCTLSQKG